MKFEKQPENLLDLFGAQDNIDTPQPEDIVNFGGETDETLFIDLYKNLYKAETEN